MKFGFIPTEGGPYFHVALLDIMSAGRVILGAAIGYRAPEFALYGEPLDGRGGHYAEMLQIIRALWTEERVEFAGRHFQISGSIEPRPARPIPIWLGGWGELSLKRAAQLAEAWLPGRTANLEKLLAAQRQYRAFLKEAGQDPMQVPTPLTREVVVAESRDGAWELAEQYVMVNYRDEYGGGWQHPLIGGQDRTPVNQLGALARDRFIVGAPEDCILAIRRFAAEFGVDHLICRLYFAGMPHAHIVHELQLLSAEVFPAFR